MMENFWFCLSCACPRRAPPLRTPTAPPFLPPARRRGRSRTFCGANGRRFAPSRCPPASRPPRRRALGRGTATGDSRWGAAEGAGQVLPRCRVLPNRAQGPRASQWGQNRCPSRVRASPVSLQPPGSRTGSWAALPATPGTHTPPQALDAAKGRRQITEGTTDSVPGHPRFSRLAASDSRGSILLTWGWRDRDGGAALDPSSPAQEAVAEWSLETSLRVCEGLG